MPRSKSYGELLDEDESCFSLPDVAESAEVNGGKGKDVDSAIVPRMSAGLFTINPPSPDGGTSKPGKDAKESSCHRATSPIRGSSEADGRQRNQRSKSRSRRLQRKAFQETEICWQRNGGPPVKIMDNSPRAHSLPPRSSRPNRRKGNTPARRTNREDDTATDARKMQDNGPEMEIFWQRNGGGGCVLLNDSSCENPPKASSRSTLRSASPKRARTFGKICPRSKENSSRRLRREKNNKRTGNNKLKTDQEPEMCRRSNEATSDPLNDLTPESKPSTFERTSRPRRQQREATSKQSKRSQGPLVNSLIDQRTPRGGPRTPTRRERKLAANDGTSRARTDRLRTANPVEENTFTWKREPIKRTVKDAVSQSERVDKVALGEVAKRLENTKRLEQSKKEARKMIRGRRVLKQHRSLGVLQNVAATASRGELNQFTWRREARKRVGEMLQDETP